MQKPTEQTIRAMLNLKNNVSWQEIVQWVEKSLVQQSILNNSLDGDIAIKGQGRGLELADLLKHIKNARTYKDNQGG